jgi:peptidoglycan/LPS O-acetylase OafA/YrhL
MFLGTISYSLYLTHNPITGASFFLLAKLGTPQWFALGATILICIAFAYAFWLAFEQPSMKLAHRVRLRSPAGEKDTTALAPSTVA